MLTRCSALDHGPAGVRANGVCPGRVRTPTPDGEMDTLGPASRESASTTAIEDVRLRPASGSEENADGVDRLRSGDASYADPAVIPVDEGVTIVDVGTFASEEVA